VNHRHPRAASPSAATAGATFTLALLATLAMTACGGSDDDTVPGAPTIGEATAGDASASIAFTAPSSSGSSEITAYTATCTDGTTDQSGDGTASPITVSGLTNDTAYSCSVTATNSAGTGAASDSVSVTPTAASSGTAGVECSYSSSGYNASDSIMADYNSSWTCDGTSRVLSSNGIPDHTADAFPNDGNPNTISEQTISATYTLAPVKTDTATTLGGPRGDIGFILNGIKIDAGTAGTCDDTGTDCDKENGGTGMWSIEALGQDSFDFGLDENNAHVQPTGAYHYHGMPEGFITLRGGSSNTMTLIGWAADGFPIYARYGYSTATDAGSALKVMTGSYQTVTTVPDNRPPVETYPLGTFVQDWEYVAGAGDLDECNGRTGVTPEFPNGIYHYYATDTYPFLQRCVKGEVDVVQPGG
jgi:hypothetical protein